MKALLKRLTPSFLYKVHCNICGGSFRKPFVEFGIVPRHNARCWNCWSLERHRILWKYLNDETDFLKRPIKLLHVAPEACFYPLLDSNVSIEYHPGDLSPDAYPHKGKSSVVKTDLTRLQYDDAFFDLVIANHVLEHIPEDRKAMAEIYRVLKPGGTAVVMTPVNNHPKPEGYTAETTYEDFSITSEEERLKAFGQGDHVRVYGQDFKNRLENVGFKYNEFDYAGKLPYRKLYYLGMQTGEKVQYVTK